MLSQVFFIADTHFGHQNIIQYEKRPFQNVQEMDAILIENWNKKVNKDDKVYILGDFAMGSEEYIKDIINKLKGYKVFVLGNHDKSYALAWWQSSGFNEVINYPVIYKEWFILSHEPLYINKSMPYANIFGHVHANPLYQDYSSQSFCVSVERINYKPIAFDEMIGLMAKTNSGE